MLYINPQGQFRFAPVPNCLNARPEVTSGARLLYAQLVEDARGTGECTTSEEDLGRKLTVSPRQVRRYIVQLVGHGLIERRRRGNGQTNAYRFLAHPWLTPDRHQQAPAARARHPRQVVRRRPDIPVPSEPASRPDIGVQSVIKCEEKDAAAERDAAAVFTQDGGSGEAPPPEVSWSAERLRSIGVDAPVARRLASHHPPERIEQACAKAEARARDNPAGYAVGLLHVGDFKPLQNRPWVPAFTRAPATGGRAVRRDN